MRGTEVAPYQDGFDCEGDNMPTDTFWLNVTNLALGVTALAPVLVVIGLSVVELVARAKLKARASH